MLEVTDDFVDECIDFWLRRIKNTDAGKVLVKQVMEQSGLSEEASQYIVLYKCLERIDRNL